MARLTAPLFSLDASGTLSKAITYSKWKGINYARTRVIPENPKSEAQTEVRGVFATLNEIYKRMPLLARAPWDAAVLGRPLTARNRFCQASCKALIDQTDLDKLVMSVASGQAVPPVGVSFTPGVLKITITATAPPVPTGYTLTAIVAAVLLDGDPSPKLSVDTFAGEDEETPYSIEITGLTDAEYQCACWCKMTRTKDGAIHYSEAVRGQATPTAE